MKISKNSDEFRDIVNAIPTAIIVVTLSGFIYEINGETEKIFNVTRDDVVDEKFDNVFGSTVASLQKKLRDVNVVTFERTMSPKSGEDKILSCSAKKLTDTSGNELIIIIGQDITQRKMAEKKAIHFTHLYKNALQQTVDMIVGMSEIRDAYTVDHERKVVDLACSIGSRLGLSSDRIEGLRLAALFHDIGKIAIPIEILSKPGKITEAEFSIIKEHPTHGYNILSKMDFPWPIDDIIVQTHERYNGSGYPKGLTGDNILIEAKIIAVADVVDAMTSHRPYRPALGLDVALEEIKSNRGILYDPEVADACLKVFEDGFKLSAEDPAA